MLSQVVSVSVQVRGTEVLLAFHHKSISFLRLRERSGGFERMSPCITRTMHK